MKKVRLILGVLGVLVVVGTGLTAYLLWSKNSFDAAVYDLWLAGRFSTLSSERSRAVIEAKNAVRESQMIVLVGGLTGFLMVAAAWRSPRRPGQTQGAVVTEAEA